MPEFSSAETAKEALGQRVPLETLTEPVWGTRQNGPMRNVGYVIGRQTRDGSVGYRYDFDGAFHINVWGIQGFDHLIIRNGNEETKFQYWDQLTAQFRGRVPAETVQILRSQANDTRSWPPLTVAYARGRANSLQILDHVMPGSSGS